MDDLRSATTADGPADAGTVLAADDAGAVEALAAYFGASDDRVAVRIVVAGETLGFLERERALDLIELRTRGLGDSSGWLLPGVSYYAPIELRCVVADCPANPIFAAGFDEQYPPACPQHPGQPLTLVGP
jgi:hypothetical protein